MHEVKQELTAMGEDAWTEHLLYKVVIQEMITDCELERLSRNSHRIPVAPSQQARISWKPHLWHSLDVAIVTQCFRVAGKPCWRPEL